MKKLKLFLGGVLSVLMLAGFKPLATNYFQGTDSGIGILILLFLVLVPLLFVLGFLFVQFKIVLNKFQQTRRYHYDFNKLLKELNPKQWQNILQTPKKKCKGNCNGSCLKKTLVFVILGMGSVQYLMAQDGSPTSSSFFSQPGIIITVILLLIPLFLGALFFIHKAIRYIKNRINEKNEVFAQKFSDELQTNLDNNKESLLALKTKQTSVLDETNSTIETDDSKSILENVSDLPQTNFTAFKKKATKRPQLDPDVTKLILWYLGCGAFWLFLGGLIGEYVGIKFVVPEVDQMSWLSFGRLRPVHTNIVFWGWASLSMIGLGIYVVPTVSNTKLYSIKWGWIALVCTNIMIIAGTISLLLGVNNGGGEFREYIWPIMAFFAVALLLTLANFILTVAKRTTHEIYISNWYIISAIIFTVIVALTAYLPFWQDGVSETIVQGYFMHSGVGMWFTLYTLGLLYYFIPQQLNKPIYAYSLGILAFWTQIIFYTVIGTHHFVFAPIPWWLQTVGIVGSAGMIIPVVAATINYSMTFKGQWNKVANSYTLPFFLVPVMYYFIVSMQGTAEAFKFTNLLWHFTDFTVAHAHLGFYGIITFALWGGVYAIVPRLTGNEPPQHLVGVHFWLAFIGILFYTIPLSIGSTLRGLSWMKGDPFIDSVEMMFEWWLWRAIGGSLMFISHIIFAYNFYKMCIKDVEVVNIKDKAFELLMKNK
ncbi:MAG: cbb3-type cytochrome c oxidase subunit I [Alphaproteobacteria bacterium]|nr:cbb3-type cytochrome c oxidase subunit I [Alphaproteobacteria bacterium]